MISCLYVALGGAIGSVIRYLISLINVNEASAFPYKTLVINVIGSLLIGLTVAFASKHTSIDSNIVLLIKVGICGGFTTFSTFALETTTLYQSGKIWLAFLYIILSVILSTAAVFLGQIIIK